MFPMAQNCQKLITSFYLFGNLRDTFSKEFITQVVLHVMGDILVQNFRDGRVWWLTVRSVQGRQLRSYCSYSFFFFCNIVV
jgi:hypothetical protein